MFGAPNNLTPGNVGGNGMFGSRVPGGDQTGTFPGNQFGGAGDVGRARLTPPGASMAPPPQTGGWPASGLGQAPALGQPSASSAPREDPNYLNGFPSQPPAAGAMGNPGQPPSPL